MNTKILISNACLVLATATSVNMQLSVKNHMSSKPKDSYSYKQVATNRSEVLWYVERFGHGFTPFYNIDFTRKFFKTSLDYLGSLTKVLSSSSVINEEVYNKHTSSTLKQDKDIINSQDTEIGYMSFGYWAGIAVTGPMCIDLKNRFWDDWEPIFKTIERVVNL